MLKNVEDASTPNLKRRKSTYHIEKDGVRNVPMLSSQDRMMSPGHNEYSENIEEYLNDNMGAMQFTNKTHMSSTAKGSRMVISQST